MKYLILCVFSLLPGLAVGDSLDHSDYPDRWVSTWVAVEGEEQTLIISTDLSSTFERRFRGKPPQRYSSDDADVFEDIIVLKYKDDDDDVRYKLALSGWKLNDEKKLYGTMFMYEAGVPFNGLPVSFRNEKSAANKSAQADAAILRRWP